MPEPITLGGNSPRGRDFAAWLGLVPKQISTGDRTILGGISRASVLEIARDSFFEAPVLLTSQPQAPTPGTLVPPKGLEVLVGPHPSAGAPVVQVTAQPSPQVKVNNRDTALASLQSTLKQLLQGRSEKLVLVNADGPVAFADLAQVIDISRSTGAKVVIATPAP